ncbi:MAG: ABC transporter permease [Myxococcaceae bacterium]|nr:ABC transporter permease [Myxococcaceae bacterium]
MLEFFHTLLFSTLEAAPPLVFAAVGASLCERAGVVNVGVEGMMRAGAFAAAAAALVMPTPLGVVVGALAGASLAAVHGLLCIRLRSDQVVSGMALNLVMLALGTFLLEAVFHSSSGSTPITQLSRLSLGSIDAVPLLGALFNHSALTYLAVLAPLLAHWALKHTRWGLRVRAVGEQPQAVAAVGIPVGTLRFSAVLLSGALAGVGGAVLSTATLDHFEHHMPSGLGFMAVAAMVFGRWTPLGAAGAATFFALADSLRIGLASSAPSLAQLVPGGVQLALPYALTLLVLAVQGQRGGAPAALGQSFDLERR